MNLVVALKTLAPTQPNEFHITINTDNAASQQVLENGIGRDETLTACAHEIWLFVATNSCEITIQHKPGKQLILADALSRLTVSQNARAIASTLCTQLAITEIPVDFNNVFTTGL